MFVGWRDLRFAKGRFVLMGTVTVLITVLVGLLSGLTAGLGEQNISAITGLSADRIAFSAPPEGQERSFSESSVGEKQWRAWADKPGVRSAEPLGITTTRAESGERTTGISVFGARPGSDTAPRSESLGKGSVVLSETAAEELGSVGKGDHITVAGHRLKVAAVSGDAAYSHTPVVWSSLADWQSLQPEAASAGGEAPRATVVALQAGDVSPEQVSAHDRQLGTDTVSTEDSLQAIGSYSSENGSLQMMRGFLFVISALVIGAFFTVWTIQRAGDVAVLKALGASTRYLLKDALGQALLLLLLGTAAGTAVAAGIGAAVAGTVPFVLDAATVLVPAAVMVILGALGAALAIRRITSVDPLTALGSAR